LASDGLILNFFRGHSGAKNFTGGPRGLPGPLGTAPGRSLKMPPCYRSHTTLYQSAIVTITLYHFRDETRYW